MPIKGFCPALLLMVLVLSGSLVQAQDSEEIITVTAFYAEYSGEYPHVLLPCQSQEVWNVATDSPAFTTLSQQYAALENSGQLGESGTLFVEVRGRYRAFEGEESHADGIFEITEFVRHSTATVDPTICPLECEDIHGADSPICLAQIDGQCGSTRNSCVSGDYFNHEKEGTTDTATHYRWVCLGSYGGDDSDICTAPKGTTTPPPLEGWTGVIVQRHVLTGQRDLPLTMYGWAANPAAPTVALPVEIYAGGPRGTGGTLAATITANRPRSDINTRPVNPTPGDHGFEWAVPSQYQSSAQTFYVYALDQSPNPTVRTLLGPGARTLLAPGHADYCANHGPCASGQGNCATNAECQSGLTCVHNVGTKYGFTAITDVCEAQNWTWNNLSTQPITLGDRAGDLYANHALHFTYAGRSYHLQHLQVSRPAGTQDNQICVRTDQTLAQAALDDLEIRVDLDGSAAYVTADFSADLVAAGYYCFTVKAGDRYTFTNTWRALGSDNTIDVVIRTR